jgi:hypothetical protein
LVQRVDGSAPSAASRYDLENALLHETIEEYKQLGSLGHARNLEQGRRLKHRLGKEGVKQWKDRARGGNLEQAVSQPVMKRQDGLNAMSVPFRLDGDTAQKELTPTIPTCDAVG